ncbi:hypothetical protein U9M48_002735, partial [Paspalum notatum var. saurae]
WLDGKTIAELAPSLFKAVPKRITKCRTVAQALHNRSWVSDIRGALSVHVLTEYLLVWELVDHLALQPDIPNQHRWKLAQSGCYSSRLAYAAFFEGTVKFGPWKRIWRTWALMRCKFFIWLGRNNRCWTADRLTKRGLPHMETYPLCDQAEETIDHILITCVFSRQVWSIILQSLGLIDIILPNVTDNRFSSWWAHSSKRLPRNLRNGFNSLVILVAWEIWKGRNSCVFEGSQPNVQRLLASVRDEGIMWCMARAKNLQELLNSKLKASEVDSQASAKISGPTPKSLALMFGPSGGSAANANPSIGYTLSLILAKEEEMEALDDD